MRAIVFCLMVSLAGQASADQALCRGGSVFIDSNHDGVRNAGEPGLAGVKVSDGERIVQSDAAGNYLLTTQSGRTTFVIKPAGYTVASRADGLPDTWINVQTEPGPFLRYGGVPVAAPTCRDFALIPDQGTATLPFEVLFFGDPQPKSLRHVDFYERDIVAPLRGKTRARLAISLGDLVDDDISLYPALKAVDATLGIPWLHAPGNHDLDFDAQGDQGSLQSFRHAFGPDTYAWEEAQANFIVLDDVIYQPGLSPAYVGGLREQQFAFLTDYLAGASKERLLVLAVHIPLFDIPVGVETFRRADRDRLFALLKPFPKVLLVSGHSHNQQHHFYGPADGWNGDAPLHEYNVGAACGAYWTGQIDAEGIPSATMSDGTPNGYGLLTVNEADFEVRWFVARASPDYQMALHAPKVLRRGSYPGIGVYANVFMGDSNTVVEFRIDEGEWKPMRKVAQADPALVAENVRDDSTDTLLSYDRLPEAALSPHLWRGALPTNLSVGNHLVEVRADVPGFGQAVAATSYRLDEIEP